MNPKYERLKKELDRAQALNAAMTMFNWDNETGAPENGAEKTAVYIGQLSMEYMQIMTGQEMRDAVEDLKGEEGLSETEQAVAEKIEKEIRDMEKIPPEEYRAYSELTARAGNIWARAKRENNYGLFAPVLKELISWNRKFAGYRAKEGQKLYDVLLEDYESGFTMEELDRFFGKLRAEIVPLLRQIQTKEPVDSSMIFRHYDVEKQKAFSHFLAGYLGFDFTRGVLAESEHPFTTSLHNEDVRITNHYYPENLESAIFSVIHETGHALYEAGNSEEVTMTPVGGGASMGMHESQSRMYENVIGRSREFWVPLYGKLQETFPEQLKDVSLDSFIRAINRVHPDLVRTEADELTYCLHIMVRYEMEKKMIEEELPTEELPEMWNRLYEEYLGIRPHTDAEGILQDVHWSFGGFGYFPSYALGNAFASQIYAKMEQEIPVKELLERGDLKPVREFLREHIHQYGASRKTKRLLKDLTGEEFNPDYYIHYLKEKYTALYEL